MKKGLAEMEIGVVKEEITFSISPEQGVGR